MKQLKFEHHFARQIIEGLKTATFRVNDDKDIRVGDEVELVDKVDHDRPTTWLVQGRLIIRDVQHVAIKDLDAFLFDRAESFGSIQEMLEVFRRFYGDHLNMESLVAVFNFNYIPYDSARPFLESITHDGAKLLSEAKLYADGGSRGNPGPSAAGFVVVDMNGQVLHSDNRYLGITTNNQAEYHAALAGMEWCLSKGVRVLHVYLDSMLVVNQMKGIFKVKNRDLWSLFERLKETQLKFKTVTFTHIPRELNKLADTEVNKALDAVKGSDVVQ